MPEDIRRDELARYLAGTASPEEAERVRGWLYEHPAGRARLEGLEDLTASEAEGRDPEAALARMRARMPEEERPRQRRADRARADRLPLGRQQRPWVPVLAAIVVIAAVGLMLYVGLRPEGPEMYLVATAAGEQQTVTLDDGTTVQLNVATRLRVPDAFGAERHVYLDGEAFFDVAADSLRPFVVHSGEAVVQVLGTSFGVQAYADDGVAVVVQEGRVALREQQAAAGTVLAPGERGRLVRGADGAVHVDVEQVRTETYLAWRAGRLVFEGVPLDDVVETLKRWYGVEITVTDALSPALRLDASFSDEPLTDVLHTIAAALDIRYRVDGARVILMPAR